MPAPMNTESRRKASADFHAKRKAEGWKKSTHWLSPEALKALEALKAKFSADGAVNYALVRAAQEIAGEAPKPKRQAKPKAEKAAPAPRVALSLPTGAKLKDPR